MCEAAVPKTREFGFGGDGSAKGKGHGDEVICHGYDWDGSWAFPFLGMD